MRNKAIYAVLGIVVVLGLGYWGWNAYSPKADTTTKTTQSTPTPTVTPTPSMVMGDHSVSYQGEDGKTALVVLKEKYPDAVISGEGVNAFVTAINGYTANTDKHEFWKMMVNGTDSQVGAGSYTTKSTDTIMWMIDTY